MAGMGPLCSRPILLWQGWVLCAAGQSFYGRDGSFVQPANPSMVGMGPLCSQSFYGRDGSFVQPILLWQGWVLCAANPSMAGMGPLCSRPILLWQGWVLCAAGQSFYGRDGSFVQPANPSMVGMGPLCSQSFYGRDGSFVQPILLWQGWVLCASLVPPYMCVVPLYFIVLTMYKTYMYVYIQPLHYIKYFPR